MGLVPACNHSSGKAEAGGFLGFPHQPAEPDQEVPSPPSQDEWFLKGSRVG